ncbi:MAG TPA: ABC transporter permease subunit [Methylomirabilota bacterium]
MGRSDAPRRRPPRRAPPHAAGRGRPVGATPWKAFTRVTLPLIAPGVIAGGAFATIVSFDDVSIALFLASPKTTTLPVRIFTYIEQTFEPLVTAVCSLLVLLTAAAVVVIERSVGLGRLFGTEDSTQGCPGNRLPALRRCGEREGETATQLPNLSGNCLTMASASGSAIICMWPAAVRMAR